MHALRPAPAPRGASGQVLAVVLAAPVAAVLWAAQLPPRAAGLPWDALLALMLVAPVAEEIVFRASLQEGLERRAWALPAPQRAALAIGLSSAVFALCHALAQGSWPALAVFVPSLALGAVYRAGGLGVAILCHAWFNLCFVVATRV